MDRPILFINACVRGESRTKRLAEKLLEKLNRPVEEVRLEDISFPVANEDFLGMRDSLVSEGSFDNPVFDLARQFSEAETIVIAAPYWDLSFPAALKQYFEQVNVVGITFRYTEEGIPVGLCKADRIFYVSTAGGGYVPTEFGFGYVKALAQDDGYTAETFNLSEKHLAYFTFSSLEDPEDPQKGEGYHFSVPVPGSKKMMGGQTRYATGLFASGIGPNLEDRGGLDDGDEEVLVYQGRNGETESRLVTWYDENGEKHSGMRRFCYSSDDWGIPDKYRFYQSYRLKDSYILPCPAQYEDEMEAVYTYNPRGTEAIKQQLLANRGVAISINAESSRPDQTTKKWKYLSPNWAQYTYESVFDNPHAVCIVGWDDDYPKENFIEGHQPPENGAWLVRNSWGSDYNEFPTNGYRHWGIEQEENKHNGYFWISYYDQTLSNPEAFVFDKSNVGSSYYVQQYDYVPSSNDNIKEVVSDSEMKTANVFVADQNAKLTEISAVTTTPNSEVSYEIYLLRSKYRNPYDGVKIQSGEGYTFEYGGYHRFELKEPVMLFRGQAYSVVISQKTPSGKSVFNIVCGEKHGSDLKEIRDDFPEEAPEGEYVDEWTEFIVNRRESYVLKDDEWLDLTTKKAYDALLGSGKKYAGDPDIYDNLPIKAYLTISSEELGTRVVGVTVE